MFFTYNKRKNLIFLFTRVSLVVTLFAFGLLRVRMLQKLKMLVKIATLQLSWRRTPQLLPYNWSAYFQISRIVVLIPPDSHPNNCSFTHVVLQKNEMTSINPQINHSTRTARHSVG